MFDPRRYWTYRMEWRLGDDGGISWYYDGEFVWSMSTDAFGEYSVCTESVGPNSAEKVADCKRTPPRQLPNEPMSLVMNTAIGTWNGKSPR